MTTTGHGKYDEKLKIYLMKKFGNIAISDLIEKFGSINKIPKLLESKFDKSLNIILVSEENEKKIFTTTEGGWNRFYSEYPKSKGIIELSQVAFNANRTRALLYYGASFDFGKGGIGYYILLKKITDKWIIDKKVRAWIA